MRFLRNLVATFRLMKLREHFIYWILPIIVSWILTILYFAGNATMQAIVAHPFSRELGLLEHLENFLLIGVIIIATILFRRSSGPILKFIWITAIAGFLFLFLEEIDYGFHYINYYRGIRPGQDAVVRNLHNREHSTISRLMWICYGLLAFILVVAQIPRSKLPGWMKNLQPSLKLQFTLLSIPLISRFPFVLNNMNFTPNGALHENLSEFEELVIYYIFFLYFCELKKRTDIKSVNFFSQEYQYR
jgi:hypothetical protein